MDRGAQQTTVHGMNHKRVEQDLELNNNNMLWVEDYFSTHNISDTKYVFLQQLKTTAIVVYYISQFGVRNLGRAQLGDSSASYAIN